MRKPRLKLLPTPVVQANHTAGTALAVANEDRTSPWLEIRLGEVEGFTDAKSGSPKNDD
jgi:hypothetical protein